MIPLTQDLKSQIKWFTSNEGSAALEDLANALYNYYTEECVQSEGNQLYRNQGAAVLSKWLKSLPKGLRDGNSNPY
jgi:hypothetical protein